ncbi:MAG: SEFIR domain-containing protein [Dehalococcoidia bacterium]
MTKAHPKLFISYSWTNQDHQQWVIDLATELRESGVDVILDKWDLKEGQDALAFMEKMVSDQDIRKVAIICDRIYVEKANGRTGGVGTETQILTPEIYSKEDQSKFVAILSERDSNGKPFLPTYYKSRIFIDLSNNDLYASNFDQLLRWIYDKPLHIKPELGKEPSFLSEENPISLETTVLFRRALDAVRHNKDYADGALGEYFSTFIMNLERFRLTDDKSGEFDDKVVDSIEKFLPFRNEAIELFSAIAQYRSTDTTIQRIHRFFENILPYTVKPDDFTTDNYKFIIHELFLYCIACLIKYDGFHSASYLLRHGFYVEGNIGYRRDVVVQFPIFEKHLSSLHYRNKRLHLNRISLQADLLIKRLNASGFTERQLIQSDFILFIRDCFDCLKTSVSQSWLPVTLVYAQRYYEPFEVFARSQSNEYFENIKILFDIQQKEDFKSLIDAFSKRELRMPEFDYSSSDPTILIGYDKISTRP